MLLREPELDAVPVEPRRLVALAISNSGGPELADELERVGYEGLAAELGVDTLAVETPREQDPFTDTTIESNPFADPLA